MDPLNSSNPGCKNEARAYVVEGFKHSVDDISEKVDTLEKRVKQVEQFYSTTGNTTSKGSSGAKDKQLSAIKKQQQDALRREATATKRMQDLMRQFGTIFRQITQHDWSWPFMDPVDVETLGLHDYYQVIEKPMDFSTIKGKMESKDGTGYKNVREIYADMRLVFKNAMKYNPEKDDVHVMAKTLLEKLEERWLQLLPRVLEEEKRRADEEAEAQLHVQLAQETAYANLATDLSNELSDIDVYLKGLREKVVKQGRKMSSDDKKKLGTAFTQLSSEDLRMALDIVAQDNPNFQATAQEVELDIDAQRESTLWRLKVFVKEALRAQAKSSERTGGAKAAASKRNREASDALAKPTAKKIKKLSNL